MKFNTYIHYRAKISCGIMLCLMIFSCNRASNDTVDLDIREAERKIRQVHADYVSGWIEMDEEKVMGLLVEDSQIQPNRFTPVIGKENIREFWFPEDGSKTIINDYTTEIISITVLDTMALTTHSSRLDWDYQKDSTSFGMYQEGINTTIYRKQAEDSWKIWRSMWTDLKVESK